MKKTFVIFDTEFTTWEGCLHNGWNGWQKREIVQISALKVDCETLDVVDEFNYFVKPIMNPILSDYFINLTRIDNETVQKLGVSFCEMYENFKVFVGDDLCYSHAWTTKIDLIADGNVINENLEINQINEKAPINYANIAPWFMERYAENGIDIKTQNSGAIAKILGISEQIESLNLDEHNAIYDCYSILLGIKFFKAKSLFL